MFCFCFCCFVIWNQWACVRQLVTSNVEIAHLTKFPVYLWLGSEKKKKTIYSCQSLTPKSLLMSSCFRASYKCCRNVWMLIYWSRVEGAAGHLPSQLLWEVLIIVSLERLLEVSATPSTELSGSAGRPAPASPHRFLTDDGPFLKQSPAFRCSLSILTSSLNYSHFPGQNPES